LDHDLADCFTAVPLAQASITTEWFSQRLSSLGRLVLLVARFTTASRRIEDTLTATADFRRLKLTTGTTASKTFTRGTAVTRTGVGELQRLWSFHRQPATNRLMLGALARRKALQSITSSAAAEQPVLAEAMERAVFQTLHTGHQAPISSDSIQCVVPGKEFVSGFDQLRYKKEALPV